DADEVATSRVGPLGNAQAAEALLEDLDDRAELRGQGARVLPHQRAHALGIAEELRVSQLVDLVRPDAADDRVALPPLQVLIGGGEEGHAGTRLRDLGGRGPAPETIRITRLGGEAEDAVH